jgi:large subunit ribosomal protein L21
MYAVLSSGGKQYRVEAGSTLELERLSAEPGSTITFDRVLLLADGDQVTVGTPLVDGASVSATVLGEALGPKLIVFKFRQKVKYRRKRGHRQHLTRVRIDAINAAGRREERAEKRAEAREETKPEETKVEPEATAVTEPAPTDAAPAPVEAEATEKPKRRAPARRRATADANEAQAEAPEAKADGSPAGEAGAEEEKPKPRRAARPKKTTTAEPAEEQ